MNDVVSRHRLSSVNEPLQFPEDEIRSFTHPARRSRQAQLRNDARTSRRNVVAVMQSAKSRWGHDGSVGLARRQGAASSGSLLAKRKMGSVVVIVGDVLPKKLSEVAFVENDDVIEEFASDAPDPALGNAVLPRTSVCSSGRPDAE